MICVRPAHIAVSRFLPFGAFEKEMAMTKTTSFLALALVALFPWAAVAGDSFESSLYFSILADDFMTGYMFTDAGPNQVVEFAAMDDGGRLTLQIDLDGQSIMVRTEEGHLTVISSGNNGTEFRMLPDDGRVTLGRLAMLLDGNLEEQNPFQSSVICLVQHFGYWPEAMPLALWMDPETVTIGDLSVRRREMEEARRQALVELQAREPAGPREPDKTFVSLCQKIGFTHKACWPTSLIPYKEKCAMVLVGGTECTGRCGTTCLGMCSGARYTVDCFNHDRCADVYNKSDRRCNFIFADCFDDCSKAPDCTDVPGVWNLTYTWKGSKPGFSKWKIYPNKTFKEEGGNSTRGTWAAFKKTFALKYKDGCKPVYSGQLIDTRLRMSGTMKCTTQKGEGVWVAVKTNTALSAAAEACDEEPVDQPSTPACGPGEDE